MQQFIPKDSFGNELKLGDFIIYVGQRQSFEFGIVTGFTKDTCLCFLSNYSGANLESAAMNKPRYCNIIKTTYDNVRIPTCYARDPKDGQFRPNLISQADVLLKKYDLYKDLFSSEVVEKAPTIKSKKAIQI